MSVPDYSTLRALAQQATPGPWFGSGCGLFVFGVTPGDEVAQTRRRADGEFIRAVSPTVLTTVLDELERLREVEAGAREAGRMIDRLYEAQRPVIDAAGLGHFLTDDGDGDWEQVWELLAQVVAAARTVGARRDAQQLRADRAVAERDALAAQVAGVRALHRPDSVFSGACLECSDFGTDDYPPGQHIAYPCPTIRALDAAQTGEPT